MKTVKRWGIAYPTGLFVDQRQTKKDAIAGHVRALYDLNLPDNCLWHGLSERQRELWRKCLKSGHRAVKLQITWEYPKP